MSTKILLAGASAAVLSLSLSACASMNSAPMAVSRPVISAPVPERPLPAELASNPAVAPWTGPYGGVPPWDKITPASIRAGFDGALALRDADIAAIVDNTAPPTFDNTIVALERSGAALDRLETAYGVFTNNLMDDEMQKVDEELSPKFAAAQDALVQNEALFRRIEAVNNSPEKARLNYEQQRLLWRVYDGFVRAGAKL
ncbi:MAG: M3 family metallopeptidase, partial [Caulobacteraceae bacterium]